MKNVVLIVPLALIIAIGGTAIEFNGDLHRPMNEGYSIHIALLLLFCGLTYTIWQWVKFNKYKY